MKGKKKAPGIKAEKSKKKERAKKEASQEKENKWQEFLRRHSRAEQKK